MAEAVALALLSHDFIVRYHMVFHSLLWTLLTNSVPPTVICQERGKLMIARVMVMINRSFDFVLFLSVPVRAHGALYSRDSG
jgi:hypothetical protein